MFSKEQQKRGLREGKVQKGTSQPRQDGTTSVGPPRCLFALGCTSLDFSTSWLHLTSVAVLCCFAVNLPSAHHSSPCDTKAAGS